MFRRGKRQNEETPRGDVESEIQIQIRKRELEESRVRYARVHALSLALDHSNAGTPYSVIIEAASKYFEFTEGRESRRNPDPKSK